MLKKVGLWVLLALLPIWVVANVVDPESNIIEEYITVDFKLHGGLMLLQMSVDGVVGNYLVDSGAPSMILNRKVENPTASFTSIAGDLTATESVIQELRIGSITRIGVDAWSMDLSHVEERLGLEVHGLIGADILASYDMLIDYKDSKLSFINSEKLKSVLPPFSEVIAIPFLSYYKNLPVVEVKVQGELLRMSFDTGAGVSIVSDSLIKVKGTNLDDVQLGLLKIQSLPIVSKDMSEFSDENGHTLDGIISVNALNTDRVLISRRKKMIYLFWEDLAQ